MLTLFLILIIPIGIGAVILLTNKGEKAEEIKKLLKESFDASKLLLKNLKKLFIAIKELIPGDSIQKDSSEIKQAKELEKSDEVEKTSPPSADETKEDSFLVETTSSTSLEDAKEDSFPGDTTSPPSADKTKEDSFLGDITSPPSADETKEDSFLVETISSTNSDDAKKELLIEKDKQSQIENKEEFSQEIESKENDISQ